MTKVVINSNNSSDSVNNSTIVSHERAQIRKYFETVLVLSKSGEKFPVNLDDVWPLVYTRKDNAVRTLISSGMFMEGIDYQPLLKNAERVSGGQNKVDYSLSVSCMEYLVAKKNRDVFEVYRQVFHSAFSPSNELYVSYEEEIKGCIAWIDGLAKLLNLNDISKLALLKSFGDKKGLPTPDYVGVEEPTVALTTLLEDFSVEMKAKDFNKKLEEVGVIERLRIRRSNGEYKTYPSLTEKGLYYGENFANPNAPNRVQPRYYKSKFEELLKLVGLR